MEVLSLLHDFARWLLVLVEAGAWLWLVTMLLALLGWTMWATHHVYAGVRKSIGSAGTSEPASGHASVHTSASALHDPIFQMFPRR